MRSSILTSVVWLAALLGVAVGQTTPTPGSAPPGATSGPAPSRPLEVREAKPSVYFVKDEKTGELVPLVGFSLEEFERMLDERGGKSTTSPKPKFRIDDIAAVGDVDQRNARLEFAFSIEVDDASWVRVPLGLVGSVLDKQAEYDGPGKFALQFDAVAKEYTVWLQSDKVATHRLKLRTTTPTLLDGAMRALRLRLPAAWHTSLKLTVPESNLAVDLSPGAVLEKIAPSNGGSRIEVSGLGGDFKLGWTKTDVTARRAPALLEAQADVAATIDGHSVSYDAQIVVSSFGGEFERFRIRLPQAAVLVADESTDVTVQKLPAVKNAKNESYEIHRVAGPTKSMIVRIQAVRPIETNKGQTTFDLGGIEVTDAVRQWGHLGVSIVGDWQVLWGERTQIRQVDAAPEFLRGRNTAAIFEYFGRTFSLNAKIAPRETRVTVEPTYVVDVTSRRAYLEAKLGYRVGGAKVFTLEADFLDWQIDEVGPPELVDIEKIVVGKGGPISMPLLEPSTGEFEITVRAHRDLPEGGKSMELFVPRPVAGVVGPASWTVRAAENVELAPRESSHAGLLRQTRGDARRFSGERTSWTYSTDAADAKFAADYRVVQRTVRVRSAAEVVVGTAGGVKQKLGYVVAREPIDALEFDVSAGLTESQKLELHDGGDVLPWVVIEEGAKDDRSAARIRVNLPQARIGAFELIATYPLVLERPASQASTAVRIPFLVPLDGELDDNELTLLPDDDVVVQHVDEAWSATTPDQDADADRRLTYRAVTPRLEAAVGLRWETAGRAYDLYVERTWIQSVWFGDTRWERAVFRVETKAGSATIRLPPQHSAVAVFVDGRRLEPSDRPNAASMAVPLGASADHRHVIDVRYQVGVEANGDSHQGPSIVGASSLGQTFRQVVYPADTILWNTSSGYADEFDWSRQGVFWTRTPRMSQAELEQWCGATSEPPLPEGANVYLFSSFGNEPAFAPATIKRSRLVLTASAVVLGAALLFLFFPILRRPAVLTAAAVAIGGIGFAFPEVVPIALQASIVGAALAFAAILLERNFMRRMGRAVRTSIEAASAAPRGSTRTRLVTPAAASAPSAPELPSPSSAAGSAT